MRQQRHQAIGPGSLSRLGFGLSRTYLLLANAATVVVAQVPVTRLSEGRRRIAMMAVAALIFAGACLLVLAVRKGTGLAFPVLVVASIAVAVGECCYTAALMPLVADLAPAGLRGRYVSAMGFSWWIGLAAGAMLGSQLLGIAPAAVFLASGAVAVAAGASALTLERKLPEDCRLTPRPHDAPGQAATPERVAAS